jgi:hypothetical protein
LSGLIQFLAECQLGMGDIEVLMAGDMELHEPQAKFTEDTGETLMILCCEGGIDLGAAMDG